MVAGAVAVDLVAFPGGRPGVRWFNVAFVLLLPHQLGHFYGDGTMTSWPRPIPVAMVVAGLGSLVLLTNPWAFEAVADDRRFDWFPGIGHYPRSLLGTDAEQVSCSGPGRGRRPSPSTPAS